MTARGATRSVFGPDASPFGLPPAVLAVVASNVFLGFGGGVEDGTLAPVSE